MENETGIIIEAKRYSESSVLITVLTVDSFIKKGFVSLVDIKHLSVGQKIGFKQVQERLLIDFVENSILQAFQEYRHLVIVQKMINAMKLLPKNAQLKELYEKFVFMLKETLRDSDFALKTWHKILNEYVK